MPSAVTYFDPQPSRDAMPAMFASPFDHGPPHPLARLAADELLAMLRAGAFDIDLAPLEKPSSGLQGGLGGKMFGVLVVEDREGRIGYLRAFSGMLGGRWELTGFAPPLWDRAQREAMWPAGQAELREYELRLRALDADPANAAIRAALVAFDARVAADAEALRERHRIQRARRRTERDRLVALDAEADGRATEVAPALHALDQESRADAAEKKRFDATAAEERNPLAERVAALERARIALEQQRAAESRDLMKQVHDSYVIENARGERRPLRELFAPGEPPAGAGDCAGPKLLGDAYRHGLRPVALAEVWFGAPPATGGRHAGVFYPSCRGKCGPVLPFMLEGLPHATAAIYGASEIAAVEPRVVFEDAWIVVVDKPIDLLSVPGRSGALRDSVQTRLRERYPVATGPLVVHRLDLDTSGLLLAAKDAATHTTLQAQFARREIEKRYIAWLDGIVAGDHGTVELALRVDLDDRPRQIHDPVHGKPAITEWRVLDRGTGATRVALFPKTGRTHQLRVHAAHRLGIGAPIVGDRLYGRSQADPRGTEPRMMLHAEQLAFVHPHTGERVVFESPAPF
ncbi:MAG: Ribosomal large subunit pseudouridine synthase [Myxococcales bacterium]|nr:Ribosomal large subunit pseudouridine synthase [Myxococcales bacterium]